MEHPVLERHARYLNPSFVQRLQTLGFARVFTTAEGVTLTDADGATYTDFLSGYGSIPFGFNHPELVDTVARTLAARPPSFLHFAPNPEAGLLAEALAARLQRPLEVSFFTNSGAEAVEGAIKLAFAATRRARLLYCHGAWHGMTLGALSLMGGERYRAAFPSLPGCEAVAFGSLDGVERRLRTKKYAAFVVEPLQAEGGMRVPPPGYLAELGSLCAKYGTALILDEIQTGLGRTGSLFAYEREGLVPDILVYAKALSGGLVPIGGYTTSREWFRRAYPRPEDHDLHSSTFGGNALACAVARRTLALLDEPLLAKVRADGEHVARRLGELSASSPLVGEFRGAGLLWGIALAPPTRGLVTALTLGVPNAIASRLLAHWLAVRLLERRFITETCAHDESVLRIEPALTMPRATIDAFVEALHEILKENESFLSFARHAGARLIGRAVGLAR
jgi:putrescine aminotransferase